MSIVHAVLVAWLFAIGTFMVLQRALTRIILGLAVLGHGAVMLLLLVGGPAGTPPLVQGEGVSTEEYEQIAAPLPQALSLTAIVISFGVTGFLLALAWRSWWETEDDEVEDDLEDALVARRVFDPEGRTGEAADVVDPEVPVEESEQVIR